jgi:hypothetical protein
VPELVVIDEVLVAKREDNDALADQRWDRVLDQVLGAPITEACGKPIDQPDRLVCLPEQQRTGIRRDPAATEISHNRAALDGSKLERIRHILCRHRAPPSLQLKSLIAKQLSLIRRPDTLR